MGKVSSRTPGGEQVPGESMNKWGFLDLGRLPTPWEAACGALGADWKAGVLHRPFLNTQ